MKVDGKVFLRKDDIHVSAWLSSNGDAGSCILSIFVQFPSELCKYDTFPYGENSTSGTRTTVVVVWTRKDISRRLPLS